MLEVGGDAVHGELVELAEAFNVLQTLAGMAGRLVVQVGVGRRKRYVWVYLWGIACG